MLLLSVKSLDLLISLEVKSYKKLPIDVKEVVEQRLKLGYEN